MLLKKGSTGANVKFLQRGLHINCFSVGDFDGIFGSKVEAAVKEYQKKCSISADGIVGDITWNRLVADIKEIQTGLNKKSFFVGNVDGLAGEVTYKKVLEFQKANNLIADGMVGNATKAVLFMNNNNNSNNGNSSVETPPANSNGNGKLVWLDAGHGGYDPGAIGNGYNEKDIVLGAVLKIGKILSQNGFKVKYTRTTDTFVGLRERANMANNANADLFVSVHNNSAENITARGTECYTYSAASSKTKQLSANVAKSLATKLGLINRGHKEAGFTVIKYTSMPAILIEEAFISNSSDTILLATRQDEFVEVIANEIIKYFN